MAAQQPYHAYAQHSKGTLMPGQTISVNKYTVQVERYLSQGGFAQVYLVRTQAPVYNTTRHVLKHVVVANESMLTEVKKEVDVMRLLKGHPNIVYLIDAAWAKMPNGAYEVYILMEYCPGGGIIDMMNRRLRERLTEVEILQIFVEVCEGVAHMHNSRPALLHRDLKVENILQSSGTSFKLCDFGSTATISKPPTNSQEIRAVEADLNRHTTLQYRAPEMIDLHSRRPIDEKSDVWALGVLLYKLCYYTTPFEEHGPLAILNVQYRFPSYPVYSQQMMHLISSMLREHGAQRPAVFEVLAHVHSLRGTKSAYNYPLPTPTPLSPRHSDFKSNPLDGVVTYRQPVSQPPHKPQPAKVTELTVPPERRGRPKPTVRDAVSPIPTSSKPSSQASTEKTRLIDTDFGADGNAAWSSVIAKHTSMANQGVTAGDEAWNIQSTPALDKAGKASPLPSNAGFNDDFAQKLWASATSSDTSKALAYSPKIGTPSSATPGSNSVALRPKLDFQVRINNNKERDAFEGLGLMTPISKPVPTLGEARKLRTGLAIMSTNVNRPIKPSPSPRLRPKPHTPRVSPIPPPRSLEPDTSSWSASKPGPERAGSSAETRFPSLEELDATFSTSNGPSLGTSSKQENKPETRNAEVPTLPPRPAKVGNASTGAGSSTYSHFLKPSSIGGGIGTGGVRSEQVTGVAMQDLEANHTQRTHDEGLLSLGKREPEGHDARGNTRLETFSVSRWQPLQEGRLQSTGTLSKGADLKPTPLTSITSQSNRSRDLLTGDDVPDLPRQMFDSKLGHDVLKIRESPSKRASVIERSELLEATIPQQGHAPSLPAGGSPTPPSRRATTMTVEFPSVMRFTKAFPPSDTSAADTRQSPGLTDNWSPITAKEKNFQEPPVEYSSSEDEGPEEPTPLSSIPSRTLTSPPTKRKGRQSSVHDLVDLWGGGVAKDTNVKDKQLESPTSFKQNIGMIKPRTAYMPQPRPSSPPRKASPLTTTTQNDLSSSSKVDLPSRPSAIVPPSPSPKAGRTRPQSMFIFPSKSADPSPQLSAVLHPPDDSRPRSSRRTSISDMVQRYEAMEASTRVSGSAAPPSPLGSTRPSPSPARDHLQDVSFSRPAKPSLDKVAVPLPGLGRPSKGAGDPIKRRTSLTVSSHPSISSQRTPVSPAISKSADKVEEAEAENIPPRSRNTSILRSEQVKLSMPTRKPVLSMDELTRQSQLEPSASAPNANNDRSPSPERPYQGVGKLIDQWQRKSAEAEASRNAILSKRASLAPPKRAGLVPHSGKGS